MESKSSFAIILITEQVLFPSKVVMKPNDMKF